MGLLPNAVVRSFHVSRKLMKRRYYETLWSSVNQLLQAPMHLFFYFELLLL